MKSLAQITMAISGGALILLLPAYFLTETFRLNADLTTSSSSSMETDAVAPTEPRCGNGDIELNEQCDDGDSTETDGCTACMVDPGFACVGEPSLCATGLPTCGNAQADPNEQCDDGNTNNDDGCSLLCTMEEGFRCEGLPSVCTRIASSSSSSAVEASAVSSVQASASAEMSSASSAATSVTAKAVSSSYRPRPRDDIPSYVSGRSASDFSVAPSLHCGDGLTVKEACDDGNTADGDGCSSSCKVEVGFFCTSAQPSQCYKQ